MATDAIYIANLPAKKREIEEMNRAQAIERSCVRAAARAKRRRHLENVKEGISILAVSMMFVVCFYTIVLSFG